MGRSVAAGLVGVLLAGACWVGACSVGVAAHAPDPAPRPVPRDVRVSGPDGSSYVVGEGWQVGPAVLRWSDDRGRTLALLRGTTTYDRGYAEGGCGADFSARAVAGWTRGPTHAHVVRRLARAVGGGLRAGAPVPAWRADLPDGTPTRLTRLHVEAEDPGPCHADAVDLAVVTLLAPGRARHRSWVCVSDRGPAAPSESDVVSVATSLRTS